MSSQPSTPESMSAASRWIAMAAEVVVAESIALLLPRQESATAGVLV